MRFRIDLKIVLFLILFYFTDQIILYVTMLIFCFIHEFGHLCMGMLLGMIPEKIEFNPFGLSISFKTNKLFQNKKSFEIKNILIAFAGPATNLLLIVIIFMMNLDENIKATLLYINILIGIFNLLPIFPLDGGRILKSFLHIYFSEEIVNTYSYKISYIIMICITVISSIAVYYFKNVAIFFIVIFLWVTFNKENRIKQLD